jgi:O-antigen/teichoic acid export membrane protein
VKNIWTGIFTTFAARLLAALVNLCLLLLSARMLGAEGRGVIHLFMVHLALINIASELMAGPSVVYFATRLRTDHLRVIAMVWSIGIITLLTLLFRVAGTLPSEWIFLLWSISLLSAFTGIQMQVRAGREQLLGYNVIQLSVPLLQCLLFGIFIYFVGADVHYYFSAWILALGLVSLSILPEWVKEFSSAMAWQELREAGKNMLDKGRWIFVANLFHLLSVRITFWMINSWNGTEELGRYGTAVSLTESLLIFSGSLSLALYARISNRGKEHAPNINKLNALALWITLLGSATLLLFPEELWQSLLGKTFTGTRLLMALYAPSVVVMASSTVLSNYFSGMAMYRIPALGSLLAFAVTCATGILLVRTQMAQGAALAVCAGNLIQFFWLVYARSKQEPDFSLQTFVQPIIKPFQIFT